MKRDWLIEKRRSLGFTQEYVAKHAYIDRAYYSQLENGKRNPSPAVAFNISNVLELDPYLFFTYHRNVSSDAPYDGEIADAFSHIQEGQILYLHHHEEQYLQHAMTFVRTSLDRGDWCVMVMSHKTIEAIRVRLATMYNHDVLNAYVSFYTPDTLTAEAIDAIEVTSAQKRLWLAADTITTTQLERFQAIQHQSNGMVSVRAYYALDLTGNKTIVLIRRNPYLMTDYEFVHSPLYHFSESFISYE
ncbi:transcriptional regulator with XRE-family HTH domain [Alkalibacillus flavidus]|uniref:Transcriptional regulator with XRE-family HTH domain n=1 Tax=Alkalibacillus flavidus TaxID=546021 RepID=A0ABV2KUP1_9BACI